MVGEKILVTGANGYIGKRLIPVLIESGYNVVALVRKDWIDFPAHIKEKIEIARMLEKLKVDIIEAGFPISSEGDFEAVKLISKEVKGPVICGLARTKNEDIDRAWEAVKHSKNPRIHTFIATSEIHREKKLRKLMFTVFLVVLTYLGGTK